MVTTDSVQRVGDNVCKKYKLQAKRPCETEFTEWCSTDDGEAVKRNIETIEGYGYQWQLTGGQENESVVTKKNE